MISGPPPRRRWARLIRHGTRHFGETFESEKGCGIRSGWRTHDLCGGTGTGQTFLRLTAGTFFHSTRRSSSHRSPFGWCLGHWWW